MQSKGMKKRYLPWVIMLLVILPLLAMYGVYMRSDAPWNPLPIEKGDNLVFEPHYSDHPGHYDFSEKMAIMSKVDIIKLWRTAAKYEAEATSFKRLSPIGITAPDFDLALASGGRLKLSDYRGKVVVFMFAAMTCPPARAQVTKWTALKQRYNADDVEMFIIYSRERHPGEAGYPNFKATVNDAEKMAYAREMQKLTDIRVAVDPITEDTLRRYGVVANAAYVIDRDGLLVFKSEWADSYKIEKVVDQLLQNYHELDIDLTVSAASGPISERS